MVVSTAADLTSPVVWTRETVTLTRTVLESQSVVVIIVLSSLVVAGTPVTTAVSGGVQQIIPVVRARVTVSLTRTVTCQAGPGVETISVSTLSTSQSLSTQTIPPGLASAPQTTAATDTATSCTESAAMVRWAAAMMMTVWRGWCVTPAWTSPSVRILTSVISTTLTSTEHHTAV